MWIDDDILRRCDEATAVQCFALERPVVVLGSSNQAEVEADVEACRNADVPILKRYGGGGTVVLNAGCVVLSVGTWVRQPFQNRFYFAKLNQAVITALAASWPSCAGLGQRGLSDISYGDRKLAGTSLFRSRNYLLYQASILVEPDFREIESLLKHPSREPEYRGGRRHRDFLLGLKDIDNTASVKACIAHLSGVYASTLAAELGDELIEPQAEQFSGLLRRAAGE